MLKDIPVAEWAESLEAFSRRNIGRRVLLEVDDVDFAPSERAQRYLDAVGAFVRDEITPREREYFDIVRRPGGDPWAVPPVVRELVDRLKKGQSTGEFQRLYVAAPANFVGRLRKHYGNSLARAVEREIIGDYTRQDERTLLRRFTNWMN